MKWIQRLTVLSSPIVFLVVLVCGESAEAHHPLLRPFAKGGIVVTAPAVGPALELINEVKGLKFERKEDVSLFMMGAPATGKAHIKGTLSVKVYKQGKTKIYDLFLDGEITSQSVSHQSVVQIFSHGLARCQGQRRFVYDGKDLKGLPSEVQVQHHSYVDGISSYRGGVLGNATSRLARPIVNLKMPQSERIITEYIRGRVSKAFDQESDNAVKTLQSMGLVSQLTSP